MEEQKDAKETETLLCVPSDRHQPATLAIPEADIADHVWNGRDCGSLSLISGWQSFSFGLLYVGKQRQSICCGFGRPLGGF
jgi:hypothetical protein